MTDCKKFRGPCFITKTKSNYNLTPFNPKNNSSISILKLRFGTINFITKFTKTTTNNYNLPSSSKNIFDNKLTIPYLLVLL